MGVKIIDKLNERMPNLVNKIGTEYEAVFGKADAIPELTIEQSSDYNSGAIVNELEFLQSFVEYQISQDDVSVAEDDYLDLIVGFFTTIERFIEETDINLRNRFDAFIKRNGNPRWMTNWSFEDVFSYFFDPANLYVVENPVETSEDLILNGDFENVTGVEFDDWTRIESGLSTVTHTSVDMLVGDKAVDIYVNPGDEVNIVQTITGLIAGWYKLEFFFKDDGNCSIPNSSVVKIQRSGDSYYWNNETKEWQSSFSGFYSNQSLIYTQKEIYFELTDTRDITIGLVGELNTIVAYHIYYDQVRLGVVKTYPSIKILGISIGTSSFSMGFWDNGEDPVGGTDYQYASFLDSEYIEGPGGLYTPKIYSDLLDKIKVAGTKAIFEISSRIA